MVRGCCLSAVSGKNLPLTALCPQQARNIDMNNLEAYKNKDHKNQVQCTSTYMVACRPARSTSATEAFWVSLVQPASDAGCRLTISGPATVSTRSAAIASMNARCRPTLRSNPISLRFAPPPSYRQEKNGATRSRRGGRGGGWRRYVDAHARAARDYGVALVLHLDEAARWQQQ